VVKGKKVGHVGFFWLLIGGEGRVGKGFERHVGYHGKCSRVMCQTRSFGSEIQNSEPRFDEGGNDVIGEPEGTG